MMLSSRPYEVMVVVQLSGVIHSAVSTTMNELSCNKLFYKNNKNNNKKKKNISQFFRSPVSYLAGVRDTH